ncbi:MAG: histidine kinase [Crocinitomicaceae bacterium]|nr:histidine kinase [Crocinitomicaceae bacterium]
MIRISTLFVNDQKTAISGNTDFSYQNRKFEFVLSSPTLRYQNEIKYHYRLTGYDENWTVNPYDEHKIIYNALSPGEYTFQVKAENQNQFSEVISYSFRIHSPFYVSGWFISLMILIFLVIVYFIYRRQLGIHKQKAKQINELNASKLTAIQSQMNPHFIFNSLNSIQDLVLKGGVENSYTYITTFSNLVRRTLKYSDKEFIDFEQELKLIELYLSLEKLRFKNELDSQINTHEIADIQIPPMLIQPFIENALVHGLLQKKGDKKLTISFELNEHLTCIIQDNGIGRAEAEKISKRQKRVHESFAVEAIQKRFDILNNLYQGSLGYRYEDIMENNQPAGTRVILTIPVKRKF